MDRREFLRSTGAAAAAATTTGAVAAGATASAPVALPAVGAGRRELRLAVAWPEGFAGPAEQAHRLLQSLAALSAGRLQIVPTFGVADATAAIRSGDADLCFVSTAAACETHKGFAYFAGLPGDHGLSSQHLHAWIATAGGGALWDDLAAAFGFKPLLAGHSGARSYLFAGERIEAMPELSGRRVAVDGLAREVARGLGMEPVTVPAGEVAGAISSGALLAAECGGAIVSYAAGLLAQPLCDAGTSFNRNGGTMMLAVSLPLWEKLSDDERACFSTAAAASFQQTLAEEEAHRRLLYRAIPEQVWPIAGELDHAVRRVADAVVAHAAGSDATCRRINDSHAAFAHLSAEPNDRAAV